MIFEAALHIVFVFSKIFNGNNNTTEEKKKFENLR